MNRRVLYFSIFLILIIAIVFSTFFYLNKKNTPTVNEEDNIEEFEQPMPSPPKTFEFYGREYLVPFVNLDAAYKLQVECDNTSDIKIKEQCELWIHAMRGEIEACENVNSELKDDCYVYFARENLSESFCQKVVSLDKRDQCIQFFNLTQQ